MLVSDQHPRWWLLLATSLRQMLAPSREARSTKVRRFLLRWCLDPSFTVGGNFFVNASHPLPLLPCFLALSTRAFFHLQRSSCPHIFPSFVTCGCNWLVGGGTLRPLLSLCQVGKNRSNLRTQSLPSQFTPGNTSLKIFLLLVCRRFHSKKIEVSLHV